MSNKTDRLIEAEALVKDLLDAYRRADYHLASEFQDVPEQWEDWRPRNAALLQRVEAFTGQPCSIGRLCPTYTYTPPNLVSICPDYAWLTWPDPALTPCRLQSSSNCQVGAE